MSKKKLEQAMKIERDQIIDILRQTEFFPFDPEVFHKQVIPYASYSPWASDVEFMSVYTQVKANTLVDIYRCYELWNLTRDLKKVNGDILEVGVWRGGTGAVLAMASQSFADVTVYLADTFTGVVKATSEDRVYRGGEHADTSDTTVKELLEKVGASNYQVLKGIFPDDFPKLTIDKLRLCHIDVDTYLSAKEIFDYAWPKISVGGVVIFDDYGFWTCEGVTKYVNSLDLPDGRKIHNLNGHGIIIKTQC
ncbi:MAG: TylF/MycF/NovP-related O-methyltransferase [Bacteroidota bacterium]